MGRTVLLSVGAVFLISFIGLDGWLRSHRNLLQPVLPSSMLTSAAYVVPHPDKADRKYQLPPHCGGEDAYFREDVIGVLGVADGVGGWAAQGVDPGIYSRQLMNLAAEEVRTGKADPSEVLQRAHARTTAVGSSTALILALAGHSRQNLPTVKTTLKVANLGDSGFVQLRRGRVLFQSRPQQHSFNYPFQLGAPGSRAGGDSPKEAQIIELEDIANGDMFVLGTDGLFDNVFAEEIASLVFEGGKETTILDEPEIIAKKIALQAQVWAKDRQRRSPFAQEARKEGYQWTGGKLDDITVVVALVIPRDMHKEVTAKGLLPSRL